jgi:signal recognition particle subunit SRP54
MAERFLTLADYVGVLEERARGGWLQRLLEWVGFRETYEERTGLLQHGRVARAIYLAMTPQERADPAIVDWMRRRRIARGSGRSVDEVSRLISRYRQATWR